jgi:hypothetical protein
MKVRTVPVREDTRVVSSANDDRTSQSVNKAKATFRMWIHLFTGMRRLAHQKTCVKREPSDSSSKWNGTAANNPASHWSPHYKAI